jgi:mannose-6-phosphate isomerase
MPDGSGVDRRALVPWRLLPNRVSRFYRGGRLLEVFRGAHDPSDTAQPEDWIGSATRAWTPPGEPPTDEGLGRAEVAGETHRVRDLVDADPAGVAGPDWPADPPTTGVLVKLLDAAIRLPVHAHPTRAFAREHLGSPFGKAEAWIVLGTRQLPGEPPPHVRLGFRRDVERDELRRWIEDEASEALLDALHDRPTAAGDVWFVPPGTPHAIGAGVFILEVQEPTDFSIVLETRDVPIDRADAHLRLGWDSAAEAIDRHGLSTAELESLHASWGSVSRPVLPSGADPFFHAEAIAAVDRALPSLAPTFAVGVVTEGHGVLETEAGELAVARGDAFAIPAAAVAELRVAASDPLSLLVCGGTPPGGGR